MAAVFEHEQPRRRQGSKVGSAVRRLGRPTPRDVLAGLVTGLFSIPEGMAYASIGGFNPVVGLYSGVVPGIIASVFARTVLMVTTLTSAIALSSRSVLTEEGLDPTDPANVAALAVVVGAVMLIFGLLRFGAIMNFVSNAVMTGFTTGIAVQIIAGVLGDATGYKPQSGNTIGKFIDSLAHIGFWQPTAVAGRGGHRRGVGGVPLRQAAGVVRDPARARRRHRGGRHRARRRRDRRRYRIDFEFASTADGSELRGDARAARRRGRGRAGGAGAGGGNLRGGAQSRRQPQQHVR